MPSDAPGPTGLPGDASHVRQATGRRAFLGALAAAGALAPTVAASARPRSPAGPRRVARFAHLTDIHVFTERRAPEGFRAALDHVHAPERGVDFIVTGGDLVFDSSEVGLGEARDRWALFESIMTERCRLPVHHCLGNHDVWGWCMAKCGSNGSEAEYGTGLVRSVLKLDGEFRSFDHAGWHVVLLNSISPDPKTGCGYLARLGKEQRAWLEQDLAATSLPTVVVSHAPIMSVTPAMSGKDLANADGNYQVSGGLLHLDGPSLHQVFRRSGKVKLALSGHLHQIDRVEAHGITYCCDGAVCGGWWKRDANHAPPCYALVDLHEDGTFEHRIVEFGWTNA